MAEYLAIDALGSSRLEHLGVSPLQYKYALGQPPIDTASTRLGTALHIALLEPDLFSKAYWPEPDPASLRPDLAVPRASKEYKAAIVAIEANGFTVLKSDEWEKVNGMADSIQSHKVAAEILRQCPEREVTGLWEREGRLCRGRFDLLGKTTLADVKTTRSLSKFNPWGITGFGYHRQAGWYCDGLRRLDRSIKYAYLIAVESAAPYDVGVFQLGSELLQVGLDECRALVWKLDAAERDQVWPGQFPDVVEAMLTDQDALDLSGVTVED
jgi:exodeoxyribonuclease VIII